MAEDVPVIFGEVPGVKVGDTFASRRELHDANVHRLLVHGIASKGSSIVLNEGYIDDEDNGDEIIYTGEGGRTEVSRKHVKDQTLTGGNLYLVNHCAEGVPVRVTRGPKLKSPFKPETGYRYDGLYRVDEWWPATGRDGFRIFRYRLLRLNGQDGTTATPFSSAVKSQKSAGNESPSRSLVSWQRIVRNTQVGREVKELYDYTCQICSARLESPSGPYAECCHIKGLGKPHNGPDKKGNVLCLCPNCHVLFDYHALIINEDFIISPTGSKLMLKEEHVLDPDCVAYHRKMSKSV